MKIITAFTAIVLTTLPGRPVLFAPGQLTSTAPRNAAPAFAPGGDMLFWGQSHGKGDYTIVRSSREGDHWSALQTASFSGKYGDLEPAFSPDGKYLIFASNRPATDTDSVLTGRYNGQVMPGGGGNLWKRVFSAGNTATLERLPDIINANSNVFSPAVVADGSLYFMRADDGHYFHIYRSQYSSGAYQTPVRLSFSIDSIGDFDPVLAPDESFMIFSSSRSPAPKTTDLFIVFRNGNEWSKPADLRALLSNDVFGIEARLSPDLRTLYYSNSQNASGVKVPAETNIWSVDISGLLANHHVESNKSPTAGIIDSNAKPIVFAPGIFSTPYSEWSTSFTPDGQTAFSSQGGSYWTVIYSSKKDGKWMKPKVAPFSGRYNDTDPFVSPDGKRIFFISNRPGKDNPTKTPMSNTGIWYADQLNNGGWDQPKQLDTAINLPHIGNYGPSVSAKGTICYCSRRKGLDGMQSFYALWLGDHYDQPKQLMIPGAAEVQDPFIAPDESYIVYLDKNDLFITFRQNDHWSEAKNLGPAVNNGDNNSSPYVSRDGKTLYYSSSRIQGFYKRDLSKPAITYDQLVQENGGLFNTNGNILMIPIHLPASN